MLIDVQMKLREDPKMYQYLKENSHWYKELNRHPANYKKFVDAMKEKYKIRPTDKMNDFVENITLINSVLDVFK